MTLRAVLDGVAMLARVAPFVATTSAGILGCNEGGAASGYGSDLKTVAEKDLAAALASAVCDNIASCCASAGKAFFFGSCQDGVAHDYKPRPALEGDAGAYDPKVAAACVNAVAATVRTCELGSIDFLLWSCVTPHRRIGEPCDSTCSERVSGFTCTGLPTAPCHTGDGLSCSSDTNTCQTQRDVGGPCTTSDDCRAGVCASGVCAPATAEGGDCSTVPCVDGFYCEAASSVCAKVKPNGSGCGRHEECRSGYCDFPGAVHAVAPGDSGTVPPPSGGTCAASTDSVFLAFACGG